MSFRNPDADTEEENASELKLGPDFQGAQCLLNSEVAILLDHRRNETLKQNPGAEVNDVFQRTLDYVQKFNHFKNSQSACAIRDTLTRKQLEQFEIAALANLCPGEAEEATLLVPSLAKRYNEDEIEEILADLKQYKQYTV